MNPGDAFHYEAAGIPSHLWVVLSYPFDDDGKVIVASVTTRRERSDVSCVLTQEDHPDLRHDSCILYRLARTFQQEWLITQLASPGRIFRAAKPFTEAAFARILNGAANSDFFPIQFGEILREQGLID